MAAFVRTQFTNNFRNLPKDSSQILKEAWAGGSEENRKSLNTLMRQPDFIIKGTTDSNTDVLNSNVAQSYAMKLVAEGGVAFTNGFDRDIDILCWTRDETGPNYQHIRQTVRGGATNPTLVGGVNNLSPNVVGQVTFATAAATAAHQAGGFSVTSVATNVGRYAAAVPKFRRLITKACNLVNVGTGDLTAVGTTANVNASAGATGVLELGIRAGAQENVAPADTLVLDLAFDLLPVESPELVIETAATPDEVLIGALGQASENVEWLLHVFVGDPRPNTAATSSD